MARDSGNAALILIDVINHFEFPEGEQLLRQAKAITRPLALLKKRIRAAGIPVIYVNDNFGQWRSERSQLIKYCLANGSPASEFVREIMPDDEDYFFSSLNIRLFTSPHSKRYYACSALPIWSCAG